MRMYALNQTDIKNKYGNEKEQTTACCGLRFSTNFYIERA